jgi:hypothetical protein
MVARTVAASILLVKGPGCAAGWAKTWSAPPAPDGRWRAAAKVRPTGQDVPTTALKEPPSAPKVPRASLGGLRLPQIGAPAAQKLRRATHKDRLPALNVRRVALRARCAALKH